MRQWCSFGASEIGPSHISTGKPNQDSWASFHHSSHDLLVVSDGLGSKELSSIGSACACRAVDYSVRACLQEDYFDMGDFRCRESFLDRIRDTWLSLIAPLTPESASATCLFFLRLGNGGAWLGMLGDGCAAAVLADGAVTILSEDKDESFSNMTESLRRETKASDWKVKELSEESCTAALLCTDGVADDLIDAEGFVRAFINSCSGLSTVTAASNAADMLTDWPTPKHCDDKTLACMVKREYSDE